MKSRKASEPSGCPCGLPSSLENCCGRYHAGDSAPTPEALMRSRYSAYVLKNEAYLLATWHPATRPPAIDLTDPVQWLGLSILPPPFENVHLQKKEANATFDPKLTATVAFIARYKTNGRAHKLEEVSRFVLEGGRWYYLNGDLQP